MAKPISQSLLENLKSNKRKIDFKLMVDWDNTGTFVEDELINDSFLSCTVDKKIEGDLGVSVIDQATVTLDNSNEDFSPKNVSDGSYKGNIIPNRRCKFQAGVNGEFIDLFEGTIENIKPNFNGRKVTFKIKDDLSKLKKMKTPTNLYLNKSISVLIKEWLDNFGIEYTTDSIDNSPNTITKSFEGYNLYNAFQELSKVDRALFYIENGIFYYKIELFENKKSEEELNPVFSFSTNGNGEVDIDEIEENYSQDEIFNEITATANPLEVQPKTIIWTGAEEESSITEIYLGSDVNQNNQLQLTNVLEGSSIETPTINVPIVANSLSIVDNLANVYSEDNGKITDVDLNSGLITFDSDVSIPNDYELEVSYKYHFNKLIPNGERHFLINLDNPAIDIENISYKAKNLDSEEEEGVYENKIEETSFNDSQLSYQHSSNLDNIEAVFIRIRCSVPYSEEINNNKGINLVIKDKADDSILFDLTKKISDRRSFRLIGSDSEYMHYVYMTAFNINPNNKIEVVINNDDKIVQYAWIRYKSSEKTLVEQDDLTEKIEINQEVYLNNQVIEVDIYNNSDANVRLYGELNGDKKESPYLIGKPIKNVNKYSYTKRKQESVDNFELKEKTFSLDLIKSQNRLENIVDFLLEKYAFPKSVLRIKTKGLGFLELNDIVVVTQKKRDIDLYFKIIGIKEIFKNGSWEAEYNLRQYKQSDWTFDSNSISLPIVGDDPADVDKEVTSVENITLKESVITLKDGTKISDLDISWEVPRDYISWRAGNIYLLKATTELFGEELENLENFDDIVNLDSYDEVVENRGNWSYIQRTTDTKYTITNLEPAIYLVKIVSEISNNRFEDFITSPITMIDIKGKINNDQIVTITAIDWRADSIHLSWIVDPEKDFEAVEVRLDENFGG